MFRTFDAYKFPVQLESGSTVWRAVELVLNAPRLLVTTEDSESRRTFLLNDTSDLLQFITELRGEKLHAVRLVLPPDYSSSADWEFIPIKQIGRDSRSSPASLNGAILMALSGQQFGGFPISPIQVEPFDVLVHLSDLGQ